MTQLAPTVRYHVMPSCADAWTNYVEWFFYRKDRTRKDEVGGEVWRMTGYILIGLIAYNLHAIWLLHVLLHDYLLQPAAVLFYLYIIALYRYVVPLEEVSRGK